MIPAESSLGRFLLSRADYISDIAVLSCSYEAWVIYNFLSLCLAYVGGPGSVEVKLHCIIKTSWHIMACHNTHLQLGACHNIPPAAKSLPVWQANRRGG